MQNLLSSLFLEAITLAHKQLRMKTANLFMVLALFLIMSPTTGQPADCYCRPANHTDYCHTRGCSNGTNVHCNNGARFDANYAAIAFADAGAYRGCNCPRSPFNVGFNGFYGSSDIFAYIFNYTTCTNFGGNARDSTDNVPVNANNATECCNFCCGRNDPYPKNKTTIITTIGD